MLKLVYIFTYFFEILYIGDGSRLKLAAKAARGSEVMFWHGNRNHHIVTRELAILLQNLLARHGCAIFSTFLESLWSVMRHS